MPIYNGYPQAYYPQQPQGQLETLRAVEDFDPDTVSVDIGDRKGSVLLTIDGLNIVNAMSQLYMSVIIQ